MSLEGGEGDQSFGNDTESVNDNNSVSLSFAANQEYNPQASSSESVYWNNWKLKIGDKIHLSTSTSEKDISGLFRKDVDIIPKNKSNVSLNEQKNSWWKWRKGRASFNSDRLVKSGILVSGRLASNYNIGVEEPSGMKRSSSVLTVKSGTVRNERADGISLGGLRKKTKEEANSIKDYESRSKNIGKNDDLNSSRIINRTDKLAHEKKDNAKKNVALIKDSEGRDNDNDNGTEYNKVENVIETKQEQPNLNRLGGKLEKNTGSANFVKTGSENANSIARNGEQRWFKLFDQTTLRESGENNNISSDKSINIGENNLTTTSTQQDGDVDISQRSEDKIVGVNVEDEIAGQVHTNGIATNKESDNWWRSNWIWNPFSGSFQTTIDELNNDDGDHYASKESKQAKKCLQKLESSKPSCWGFVSHDDRLVTGELSILNTDFEDEPVMIHSRLPLTKMENDLQALANDKSTNKQETQVFPQFDTTYRPLTMTTRLRLMSRLVFNHSLATNSIPIERHVYYDAGTRKQNDDFHSRCVVVDIQNFFPDVKMSYSKDVLAHVKKWAKSHETSLFDVELISLKGKDTIVNLVDNYFNLIVKNWILLFTRCDYLLFIAHYNSSPIAVHLLEKLYSAFTNIFSSINKIGIVSVNGAWLGPVKKQANEPDSTAHSSLDETISTELYGYNDPDSLQSIKLNNSLKSLLAKNKIKISCIAGLNETFVPLYSSLCYQFSHPNINRLFFADNSQFGDFVVKLIEVCLIVKNMGYEDYNMIVYLSKYLLDYLAQKSTPSGVTSTPVFQESLRFCFETTTLFSNDLSKINIEMQKTQDNDEEQIQEGQFLRHHASKSQHDLKTVFKTKQYYLNNPQDIIKFHKINYKELIANFNEFQYPWILNKLVKELQMIQHIDVESTLGQLRRFVEEWNPKDPLSQKLKSSLNVIAVEEYL